MDSERIVLWREADRLFARWLEQPADARASWLSREPVDATVLQSLHRLIERHGAVDATLPPLDMPAFDARIESAGRNALAGRRVGEWELTEEIGRGGMSVVYRARRTGVDFEQFAAVKLLGLAVMGVRGSARFDQERRILARLRHPQIAALIDGGFADDGTPFLAMTLVEGCTLTEYCETHRLDWRQRVRLVREACHAVAHAHRNLLVHRDLKPSNILVTPEGVPILIDFGIAKLLDGGSEHTQAGMHALTPGYAAPEQVGSGAITTAADVHALGVILRELCLPSSALPPDLNNIIAMATREDAERRHPDARALGDDLDRLLHHQPVQATPDSAAYRMRKFVARNRVAAMAGVTIALLLGIGIVAGLWQNARIRAEGERAIVTRDLLIDLLAAADPTVSDGADPPASELLRRGAREIRERLSDRPGLLAELLLVIGRSQLNRAQFEDAAKSFDDALALHRDAGLDDPALLVDTLGHRAKLAYEMGHVSEGIEHARVAERIAAEHGLADLHGQALVRLADLLMFNRQLDEAVALADKLIAAVEATGTERPDHYFRALLVLGTAAEIRGKRREAVDWLERAAKGFEGRADGVRTFANIQNTIGVAHLGDGRYDKAESALRTALDAQIRLFGADHPDTLVTRSNLAGVRMKRGDPAGAADEFEQILTPQRAHAHGHPHPDVAIVYGYLARARYLAGDTARASAAAEAGHAEWKAIAEPERAGIEWLGPFTGLMRMELGLPDPDRLLAGAHPACNDPSSASDMERWLCLAQALLASDQGTCPASSWQVPEAVASLGPIDRRWWIAHGLARLRCGDPASAARARTAIADLARSADRPFPSWLESRLRAHDIAQTP